MKNEPRKQELYHHGILGMRWGKRNGPPYPLQPGDHSSLEKRYLNTKSGESLTMERNRGGIIAKVVRKISPKIAKEQDKFYYYDVKNQSGKKVGSFQSTIEKNGEFNIVWADTKKPYRGKGYMSEVLKEGEKIAKELGAKKITAELVDESPDIKHIVLNKNDGYVIKGKVATDYVMETWGGLTLVEKKIND